MQWGKKKDKLTKNFGVKIINIYIDYIKSSLQLTAFVGLPKVGTYTVELLSHFSKRALIQTAQNQNWQTPAVQKGRNSHSAQDLYAVHDSKYRQCEEGTEKVPETKTQLLACFSLGSEDAFPHLSLDLSISNGRD